MAHVHNSEKQNRNILTTAFLLIFSFMIVEASAGFLTNSLALLSDAGHMLSDTVALGFSLFALLYGRKPSDARRTYGYSRTEIIAAFGNGLALLAISVTIAFEGVGRLFVPKTVAASGMLAVAISGLIVNLFVMLLLLKSSHGENLNLKSALFHVFADLLGSIAAIIAALFIYFWNWVTADALASLAVSSFIFWSGLQITREAVHILLEGKPNHVNIEHVKQSLLDLSGVKSVHDLHVWLISPDFPALSCHLTVSDHCDRDQLLEAAIQMLKKRYDIKHTTIQIEGRTFNSQKERTRCN